MHSRKPSKMGYILERTSGQSYDDLVTEYVIKPYDLTQTYITLPIDEKSNLATPYRKEDRVIETKPWRTGKLVAASEIYSTTSDLGKF
ncbi:MAG: beta-lactamase family protein [Robiginitomaculum sp.]|nr:beta-lactamase family protein [Robiginitomaculum sp.]